MCALLNLIPETITFSNEPLTLSSCSSVPPPTYETQAGPLFSSLKSLVMMYVYCPYLQISSACAPLNRFKIKSMYTLLPPLFASPSTDQGRRTLAIYIPTLGTAFPYLPTIRTVPLPPGPLTDGVHTYRPYLLFSSLPPLPVPHPSLLRLNSSTDGPPNHQPTEPHSTSTAFCQRGVVGWKPHCGYRARGCDVRTDATGRGGYDDVRCRGGNGLELELRV